MEVHFRWEDADSYDDILVGVMSPAEWFGMSKEERRGFRDYVLRLHELSWTERQLAKDLRVAMFRAWQKVRPGEKLSDPFGPGFGDYHEPFQWPFDFGLALYNQPFRQRVRRATEDSDYSPLWRQAALNRLGLVERRAKAIAETRDVMDVPEEQWHAVGLQDDKGDEGKRQKK